MSKKKKHHSGAKSVGQGGVQTEQLANHTSKQKKMDPTARNLLLCDLIFLIICQMCYDQKLISEAFTNVAFVIGVVLMVIALWIQFGSGKGDKSAPSGGGPLRR